MKVFMAILTVLCLGAMMNEKDGHGKMMWCACFITTIIVIMMLVSLQVV